MMEKLEKVENNDGNTGRAISVATLACCEGTTKNKAFSKKQSFFKQIKFVPTSKAFSINRT